MILILDVENTTTKRDGKLHLDPFEPTNTLTQVGVMNMKGKHHFFTFDHKEKQDEDGTQHRTLQSILDKTTVLVGHNLQHDLQWLWGCGFKYEQEVYDTMLAEYILQRGLKKSVSLAACAERYELDYDKQDTLKEYFKKGYATNEIPLAELSEYLTYDLLVTKALYERLEQEYAKPDSASLVNVRNISNNVCKTLTRVYINGFKIDKHALTKVRDEFVKELEEIEVRLNASVKLLMGDTPINLNSPEQVSQVIYSRKVHDKKEWAALFEFTFAKNEYEDAANSSLIGKTKARTCDECDGKGKVHKKKKDGTPFAKPNKCKKCDAKGYLLTETKEMAGLGLKAPAKSWISANGFSTSKSHLDTLISGTKRKGLEVAYTFLTDLKRQSAVSSYLSSFVDGIQNFTKPDGFLHVGLTQHVTATGRFSGRNPNMQNMPRGGTFPVKRVFISRWEGGKILEADFAQLEFRVAALLSQDKTAMEEVDTGFDVHSYTAKIISDAGQPTSRQEAKAHTFAPLYGATGYGRSKAEAEYYTHFIEKYKGIAAWHKRLGNEAMRFFKITTPSGRQYAFPDVERRGDKVSHFTMIKNYPVQGFATGDIVPIILLEIEKHLEIDNLHSLLVNTVHDSVVLDVHPAEESAGLGIIKDINNKLSSIIESYYDIDVNVPMLLEAKIGNNWLDTKDV